ncbi:MAG: sigma-70 family RNA polymerase sigma factor [Terrimicrobiaceae bacterium]|nr:sigma-70 family RNA polymerase sigma factor [Terrimicrobiaceae bacterium]
MDHESELLGRARGGDTKAFDEIVTCHRSRIYALIFQILRNQEDALDLTQDTFIRAWRSLRKFDGRHPLGTWLHRIATNAAIDLIRRRQARPQCELNDGAMSVDPASRTTPSAPAVPGESIDRQDLRAILDRALASLSPEHRAVVVLREVEELSYEEIAERTKTSMGTVMSRLFYARKHLQTLLKDAHEEF